MILNIGICGTCRVDFKIKKIFPYDFSLHNYKFFIRPVG